MKKNLFIFIFGIILVIGVLLRFYQLGNVPSSLDWDEVSWGYNSYAILLTGKDEHGISYPTSFQAFGEYKLPIYGYVDVLPIALFGLTPFAVRTSSAFFGSLSCIFVFLLVYEIFKKEKERVYIALLSMFFFAISPWSIQFSRIAFESNLALFFIISGAWLFLKGINEQRKLYLFSSTIILAISSYTYLSEKIFAPLLMVGMVLYGWRFFSKKKLLIISLFLFFILLNSIWIFDKSATTRGKAVLFTSEATSIVHTFMQQNAYDHDHDDTLGMIMHNRRIGYIFQYSANYLSHFNPAWLFIYGDNPRHHTPGMGNLLLIDIPFIIAGIWYILKKDKKVCFLLFYWLLLAPAVSALTIDSPHASRSIVFLPVWQIFTACGWFLLLIQSNRYWAIVKILAIILLMINIVYFIHQYFIHTNTDTQKDWQYGYKEAIESINTIDSSKKIVFDNSIEEGYMFYLFYTKTPPEKYIKINQEKKAEKKQCYAIKNAYFGSCDSILNVGDYYITTKPDATGSFYEKKKIMYANNNPAVYIYEYK